MVTISNEARLWAVKELARRAGVTQDFFRSWTVNVTPEATIVRVQPGTAREIRFRNLPADSEEDVAGPKFRTVRGEWTRPPAEPVRRAIPDLIVPFCQTLPCAGQPLFRRAEENRIECFADLPVSTLFCLCRVEEEQHPGRDVHSRFTSKMSVARRDGFLSRPIVDEWGLAFAQALEALMPGWRPKDRVLRAKISHDVDEVGRCTLLWPDGLNGEGRQLGRFVWRLLPFDLRHAIRLSIEDRSPRQAISHLWRTMGSSEPDCLGLLDIVVRAPLERSLDSAVYWKASRLGPFDSGYDPRDERIRTVIRRLGEQGVENGFHAGYRTFDSVSELQAEIRILREVVGDGELGGRQHYLRWSPQTWADWENCGLAYDSTVGYSDQVGFRAGTCIPYHPWLLSSNREARLLEIPLIAMDTSFLDFMQVRDRALLQIARELINRCRVVGGVFTFLCHNTSLRDLSFAREYEQILNMLGPTKKFDWKSCLHNEWLN